MIRLAMALFLGCALFTITGCGGDARLGSIALAAKVDAQGRPSPSAAAFAQGDVVFASVELQDTHEGLQVKAAWRHGSDVVLSETQLVPRDAGMMDPVVLVFKAQTTAAWEPGEYSFEVFVPDQGTTRRVFRLEPRR